MKVLRVLYETIPFVSIIFGLIAIFLEGRIINGLHGTTDFVSLNGMGSIHHYISELWTFSVVSVVLVMILGTNFYRLWEVLPCCNKDKKAKRCTDVIGRTAYKICYGIVLLMAMITILIVIFFNYLVMGLNIITAVLTSACEDGNQDLINQVVESLSGDMSLQVSVSDVCHTVRTSNLIDSSHIVAAVIALISLIMVFSSGYKDLFVIRWRCEERSEHSSDNQAETKANMDYADLDMRMEQA